MTTPDLGTQFAAAGELLALKPAPKPQPLERHALQIRSQAGVSSASRRCRALPLPSGKSRHPVCVATVPSGMAHHPGRSDQESHGSAVPSGAHSTGPQPPGTGGQWRAHPRPGRVTRHLGGGGKRGVRLTHCAVATSISPS